MVNQISIMSTIRV